MNNSFITLTVAAFCLFSFVGCKDDFPTVLNKVYADEPQDTTDTPELNDATMKLGTYNLWISNKGTGGYIWTARRSVLAKSIVDNDFDIFGFQEANSTIQEELPTLVANQGGKYAWWFVGRDSQDGKSGEAIGIAYDPDRFELTKQHYFWLSDTPDVLSYGWEETGYHRIAICAIVEDKLYNKEFFMMVTHGPLNDDARAKAAELLIEREKLYNAQGLPSVLVGDMNASPSDPASVTFRSYWSDSRSLVPSNHVYGPLGTFQSHNTATDLTKESTRIDYIYVKGDVDMETYKVDNSTYDGIFPSDHCPVSVQMVANHTPDNVEGNGTEASPYRINSVSDWNAIAASINNNDGEYAADAWYSLENDIDFADKSFVAWNEFGGVLDGAGYQLKNINSTNSEDKTYGVICINDGTVKDIGVEGDLSSVTKGFGGIAGTNNGTIDGASYKGELTGLGAVSYIGGIAGLNQGIVVNCANLGGRILASNSTKAENCGGIVGGVTQGNYVINCYSWIDEIESSNNNIAGIVGFVGNDSFVINSYSALGTIKAAGTYCSAVAYSKIGNLQNIYGNADCSSSKEGAIVANDKKAGTVWPATSGLLMTLDQMKAGSVSVPSSQAVCSDFAEALNAGVKIFEETPASVLPTKPNVVLKEWTKSGTYPIFK